ncbi:MAG: cbb3-type cytochrome c oxidase subunit II [Bacteriovoracaceae bacterium]
MKNLEKFSTVFLVAGFGSFLVAFLVLGIWPAMMTNNIPEDGGLPGEIPDDFKVYYTTLEDYQKALLRGRDLYVAEACWHCHSQYVRPVGAESVRYGLISTPGEYENELNRPQLFGTRRVGPDLTREAGKRTNDWHFAHLYDPKNTVVESVMPRYSWYFEKGTNPPKPTKDGVALVAYIQSLGKWATSVNSTHHDMNEVIMPPVVPSGN